MELKLHLAEDETFTVVHAELNLRGEHFEATGQARRNPTDPPIPVIGEELAVARALQDLTGQLLERAHDKIERHTVT